ILIQAKVCCTITRLPHSQRLGDDWYASTFWLLGRRFRTYDVYVEDETRAALRDSSQYSKGLIPFPHVVTDRNLVTSRYWLFDAMSYSVKFAEMVESRLQNQ
ncbi:MAG: hypothetical protein IH588_13280, partial [Anaerolineales bacterium]|nr:hypothetical protein [Anaerolineales bacterium]